MKSFNSFVSTILILQMSLAFANEIPFEVLSENKLITELRTEKNDAKKEALYNSIINKCPFKDENSDLNTLTLLSLNLSATSGIKDSKTAECQSYVDDINASVANTKKMQTILTNSNSKVNEGSKERLEDDLKTTLAGTSSLHSLLAAQCSADKSKVVSRTNQIIGAVESGSSAVAFINPVAAMIGVGAAGTGRLIVGLGGWLKNRRSKKLSGTDVKDSERFINDLCSFRELTYKYDEISNAASAKASEEAVVTKKDPDAEKKLLDRKIALEVEIANNKDLIACSQNIKDNVDSLQAFSAQLAPFINKPASQKECLNILNNYLDSKNTSKLSPIDTLASRFNCSALEESLEDKKNESFCKNYQTIEKMSQGDFYESCEDESFQKTISTKFISLTDLIMRSIQDDMKEASPAIESIKTLQSAIKSVDDELQLLRTSEQNEKLAAEKVDGLKSAIDINRITNLNTSRAITSVGRDILGERFDVFAEKSLKSAAIDIKEAASVLKDLVKQNNKIQGKSFFSKKYSEEEKAATKVEICESALQVKRQFINGYRSYAGIKDVCDFTKGDGVPPLKSLGINYDSYSASSNNRANNLTNRCKKIDESVAKNNKIVKEQMSVMSGLECGI